MLLILGVANKTYLVNILILNNCVDIKFFYIWLGTSNVLIDAYLKKYDIDVELNIFFKVRELNKLPYYYRSKLIIFFYMYNCTLLFFMK